MSGADKSANFVTPGAAIASSSSADNDDQIDRHISQHNSDDGEDAGEIVDEAEFESGVEGGSIISNIFANTPKPPPFNPFKVPKVIFDQNPEALGIPHIDRYSTYDDYIKYIDSPDGIKAEYLKLTSRIPSSNTTTVVANVPVVSLKGVGMGYDQCKRFRDYIDSEAMSGRFPNRMSLIDPAARVGISAAFMAKNLIQKTEEWFSWDDKKFFEALLFVFPKKSAGTSSSTSVEDQLRALRLHVDFRDATSINTYVAHITEALTYRTEKFKEKSASKILLQGLVARTGKGGMYPPSKVNVRLKEHIVDGGEPETIEEFLVRLYRAYQFLCTCVMEVQKLGMLSYKDTTKLLELDDSSNNDRNHNNKRRREGESHNDISNNSGNSGHTNGRTLGNCNACGKENVSHRWEDCLGRKHPEHNPHKDVPWKDSAMGKAWLSKGKKVLSLSHLMSGEPWVDAPKSLPRGETLFNIEYDYIDDTCDCQIYNTEGSKLTVATLFDTGAPQGNYISKGTAEALLTGDPSKKLCKIPASVAMTKRKVKLGTRNAFGKTEGVVSFYFSFFNEINKKWETIPCIQASIIDTDYDLIIGRPTIQKYKLTQKIISYFEGKQASSVLAPDKVCTCCCEGPDSLLPCDSCEQIEPLAAMHALDQVQLTSFARTQLEHLASLRVNKHTPNRVSKDHLLEYIHDHDDLLYATDVYPLKNEETSNKSVLDIVSIAGPEALQSQLRKLVTEFADIHAESVRPEPADIPPMELKINNEKWEQASNRLPPRTQSQIKEAELREQVTKAVNLSVLQPSIATAYSQVLLVPKPDEIIAKVQSNSMNSSQNIVDDHEIIAKSASPKFVGNNKTGYFEAIESVRNRTLSQTKVSLDSVTKRKKWRFCVDYVRLNDATESVEVYPIPNIQNMIRRIGEKRPKYFAVMDLTSGYHQAPLSLNSRKYTAFICFLGLFEWLRVPMGLKGAPSYFQRVLSTVVLTGLIYLICELYIDDILVFGRTEEEFIKNLREVFLRFRKHKLTLNPKKCRYGISQVEYVGHVIDENGVTFSKEKREKVLTFPLPTHMKQLKKFLGLANYFRDHVKNHSDKVRPLQKMIDNYDKRKRLDFSSEMEKLFYEIRDEISSCPTLFFLDPNGEIFVQTDASDYGIGAYIFQKVNGVERPAWFISKTLDSTQCNWSTPEKEAYAIYYTLMHAEHLLRDVHFVLQTDHRNLTFINMEGSPKIRRWKLAIQEYDFDIEYLPGEKNIVADNFSRLCDIESPDETLCTFSELRIPDREYRLISKVHNSSVGHHGVERTIDKLHKLGHNWTHLREHVRKFIRQCPCCQLMSYVKIPIKTHPFTRATYLPMECLNIDTVGPVPKDQFGNEYILVIIDCFTRFVELYPIPDTTAISAARAILSHVGRYGVAAKYLTDNGPQYANDLLVELRQLLRTEHEFTIPYSKEENSIVERANKEVMRHLRAIVFDARIKDTWSMDYLPLVMRILNSEEKERTGVTPAELLFGNTIQLDRRILCPAPFESNDETPMRLSAHMEKLLKAQGDLIKVAQEHQSKHDEYHMSKYESGFTEFPINSYVLLAQPDGERPSNKLKTNLQGPFRIVNINGAKYTIQNLLTSKNMDVHISRLKPFIFDHERTDPKEVAMHDQEEFLIEAITAHRGDRTRRKTMEFKVRWAGYDSSHDTWEPYSNLRDTDQLLDYLKANNLKALINKKHKQ